MRSVGKLRGLPRKIRLVASREKSRVYKTTNFVAPTKVRTQGVSAALKMAWIRRAYHCSKRLLAS